MTDPLLLTPKDVVDRVARAVADRCRWSTSYVRRRRAILVLSWLSDEVWRTMHHSDEDEIALHEHWSAGNSLQAAPATTTVQMRGEEPVSMSTMHFGRLLQSLSYTWSDELSETPAAPKASADELGRFLLRWNDREQIIRAANTQWRPLWLLRSRVERVRAAVYGGPHFYWDESLDPDYGDDTRETDPYVLVIDAEHAAWRWQGEERIIKTERFLDEMESLYVHWARLAELPARPAGARVLSASYEPVKGHLFSDGVFVMSDRYASDRLRLLAQRALQTALADALQRLPKESPTEARAKRVTEMTDNDPQLSVLAEDLRAFGGVDDQLWNVVREHSPTWNTYVDCWVITWQTAEGDDLILPVEYNPGSYRHPEVPPIEPVNLIIEALGQEGGWACSDAVTEMIDEAVRLGRRHMDFTLFPATWVPGEDAYDEDEDEDD